MGTTLRIQLQTGVDVNGDPVYRAKSPDHVKDTCLLVRLGPLIEELRKSITLLTPVAVKQSHTRMWTKCAGLWGVAADAGTGE